jgi:hypothetical protein
MIFLCILVANSEAKVELCEVQPGPLEELWVNVDLENITRCGVSDRLRVKISLMLVISIRLRVTNLCKVYDLRLVLCSRL